jgi:hypothetical protein
MITPLDMDQLEGRGRASATCHVTFGSFSTKLAGPRHVCYSLDSDWTADIAAGLVRANMRHIRKRDLFRLLEVHHSRVRPPCRGVKFVHTAKLNALVENCRT